MAKVNAQVFINTNDLGLTNPPCVAVYRDDLGMPEDTHGGGMTVLYLTNEAIQQPTTLPGVGLCLKQNWQDYPSGASVAAGTAARRIEQAFPASEQISALQQTNSWMQQYGVDPAKWPQDARNKKAEFDEKWKYVEELNAKAQSYAAHLPHDVSSDKNWPPRPSWVKVQTYTPPAKAESFTIPPSPNPPLSASARQQPQPVRIPTPPNPPVVERKRPK
jgi:hypothetical protein